MRTVLVIAMFAFAVPVHADEPQAGITATTPEVVGIPPLNACGERKFAEALPGEKVEGCEVVPLPVPEGSIQSPADRVPVEGEQ
jgi:hypothetical protein